MTLFRCLVCPAWRRLLSSPTTPTISRTQTSSAIFSNVETSLSHNLLVFEYRDRILPFLAGIGIVQFIALDAVAYWSFYLFGTVTARSENLTSDSTLLERASTIVPTTRFRYTANASIIVLSESAVYRAPGSMFSLSLFQARLFSLPA